MPMPAIDAIWCDGATETKRLLLVVELGLLFL